MIKYNKYLFIIISGFLVLGLFFFVFIDKAQNKENVQTNFYGKYGKFEFPLFEKTKISTDFFTPISNPTKINNADPINDSLSYQKAFVLEPVISPVEPIVEKDKLTQPELSAKSYVIYDIYNKTPIAIKNPNSPLRIASITKILVAMLISDFFKLNDTVEVPTKIPKLEEKGRIFQAQDKISIHDLIEAMIVASSNEAALILENYFEEKTKLNFIDELNKKASKIGMTKSHFSNAVGYDTSENISTIFDLITLAKSAQNYLFFKESANKIQVLVKGEAKNYLFKSTSDQFIDTINKMAATKTDENNILLLKTGTTQMAKENILAHFVFKNRHILIIILGSKNRIDDFAKIITYLQQFFTD